MPANPAPGEAGGWVLVRGGGDLASGTAVRLHRAGLKLVITELPEPLAVRRTVSFSEAVYEKEIRIEGITGRLAGPDEIPGILARDEIPVLIDPDLHTLGVMVFAVMVDARMLKQIPEALQRDFPLHIGLGPGFHAGRNCHAVVETRRSHTLGRVYWEGPPQPDSGQPEGDPRRVLRAPVAGTVIPLARIADHVDSGQPLAEVNSVKVLAPFPGVLRGLIRPGMRVRRGMKIGDVDPRDDPAACFLVSDKSLAIGGGVLEAILSRPEVRTRLWKP